MPSPSVLESRSSESDLAAVLIWRSPLAVARSLQKRDGFHLADGIALWERYNRAALGNLVGINTFVCSYEAVSRDPTTAMNTIADWLSDATRAVRQGEQWHREQSADSIVQVDSAQEHDAGSELLLPQHHDLVLQLSSLEGGHLPLQASSLASESGWTTALLARAEWQPNIRAPDGASEEPTCARWNAGLDELACDKTLALIHLCL